MKITNSIIYFDAGGVIVRHDSNLYSYKDNWEESVNKFSKTQYKYEDISKLFKADGIKEGQGSIFDTIEHRIDIDEILYNIIEKLELRCSTDELFNEIVKNLGKCRVDFDMLHIIKDTSKLVNVGLLSNCSIIDNPDRYGYTNGIEFTNKIYSFKEKQMKPYREIYEIAQGKYLSNRILFIDDVEGNLKIPRELGWNVYKYDNSIDNLKKVITEFVLKMSL